MPLKAGKSKATVSKNISEMVDSPTFARGKSPAKRQEMAAAAAYEKARKAGGKFPRKQRRRKHQGKSLSRRAMSS